MCSGSKTKPSQAGFKMEGEFCKQDGLHPKSSVLFDFAASDDLMGFKNAVEEEHHDIEGRSLWYGRRIRSKKMGYEERTPLMIAAMFGSKGVLNYILDTGDVDVNRSSISDGATALHCAVAGCPDSAPDVVKLLLSASADANIVDANGNKPFDLIHFGVNRRLNSRKRIMQISLEGGNEVEEACLLSEVGFTWEQQQLSSAMPRVSKDVNEKKEYPIDPSLPDMNNGIYCTDEFRMYTFKVKPCSRAYSHDWTECPFVHPGENARRRDPSKYNYSCVPCPEFRKGSCSKGDSCDYAHGIFECWLHPAQYRTRLCKDETGCTRKVCFFAHRPDELRPLYAMTGSAMPSPRALSSKDMGPLNPLALGSPSFSIPPSSPHLSPSGGVASSMGGTMWQNHSKVSVPYLQLPGSRMKTGHSAREINLDMQFFGLEQRRQQVLADEISHLSSPSSWKSSMANSSPFANSTGFTQDFHNLGGLKPSNLDDILGSMDSSMLLQLQGLTLDTAAPALLSPTEMQVLQNGMQKHNSYTSNLNHFPMPVSPMMGSQSFQVDSPRQIADLAVMNSRAAAFSKRSQSFIERNGPSHLFEHSSPAASSSLKPSAISDWGSSDGKLNWAVQGYELHKLRKSASFGFRSNTNSAIGTSTLPMAAEESDISLVHSFVEDGPPVTSGEYNVEEQQRQCHNKNGGSDIHPAWVEEPFYMEH